MAKDLNKLLGDLVELDYDAVGAYETAIKSLTDAKARRQLEEFKGDHERHITQLQALMQTLGATPPTQGDFKSVLTKGKVALGTLAGDKAILAAMKSNEDQTNAAYENAVQHPRARVNAEVLELLQRNLKDERRHRDWLQDYTATR